MFRMLSPALSLVGTLCCAVSVSSADDGVARKIDSFQLHDFRGKVHSLSDYADQKAIVVAFIGVECPLARLYAPRLESLAAEYGSQGVTVLAIDSNRQDSVTDLAGFAQRHELTIPVLKDPNNVVADRFGAQRTPEAFVLDAAGNVRYHGRIDDQYGQHITENEQRVSYQHSKPRRRDLAIALDQILAGEQVEVAATPFTGCLIGRVPKTAATGNVTYCNQIARILNDRCVECHREGEIAPFALTEYEEVAGWSDMIAEVVDEGRMPPWNANPEYGEFQNDCRLSKQEKDLIFTWVENGTPEGDPSDLPEPPVFTQGWQIEEPDQIIYMSDEPYHVAAEGTVEYQYFMVDPGWTEDKWIKAAEARPDNRAVVHHIIAYVSPPGGAITDVDEAGLGIAYAPGIPPQKFEPGAALYVPAGSKFLFQMHYTPNGTPQQDRSYIGVKFTNPEDVTAMVQGGSAITERFKIPAGEANHRVEAEYRFKEDQLLVSMLPHMHLRGKSFRYIANYPDGKSEILLDVPRYDFNWQLRYTFAEPKVMPSGTVMRCVAHFDNSPENLSNPDPTKDVYWGDQTWEEMMIGFFSTRSLKPVDEVLSTQRAADEKKLKQMQAAARLFIKSMDKDNDGALSKQEISEEYREYFDQVDTNSDRVIDIEEIMLLGEID